MNKGRILVVEDDLDISNMLRIYFDAQGYEVLVTGRGGDALELCRKKLPHVVILDIMLPDLDGYEVCKKLKSNLRTSHIPIMFLTQRDERTDKIAGLELGADDYITKPFDIEELKFRIHNAVARTTRESLTHPVTGLPSGKLIEEQLRLLMHKDDWAILYIGLKDFGPFNEIYGFMAGDDVLCFTAMVIGEAVDELGTTDDFIGHTPANDFVLITTAGQAQAIKERVMDRFATEVGTFYNFEHREQGYIAVQDSGGQEKQVPLMALAVGAIAQDDGPFADIREIIERAAEARDEGKELESPIQNGVVQTTLGSLNPVTGLPGSGLIEEELGQLVHRDDWALLYLGINHFEPFKEVYGSEAGDKILRRMKMIMTESVDEPGPDKDFIGHVGDEDFVVITAAEQAQAIKEEITDRFASEVKIFYNFEHWEQGYITIQDSHRQEKKVPLMTLDVGVITQDEGPFTDIRAIVEAAAAARRAAMRYDRRSVVGTLLIEQVIDPGKERARRTEELKRLVAHRNKQREILNVYQEEPSFVQLLEETRDLIAGVCHDLRSGLGIIKNAVELMLAEMSKDDQIREKLKEVDRSSEYCKMLLHNLLELGFERRFQPDWVSLNGLCKEAGSLWSGRGIDIQLEMPDNTIDVYADDEQLKQVFINLIHITWATTSGVPSRLSIKLEPVIGDDYALIKARSSTLQISSEHQESVFDLGFMLGGDSYNVDLFIINKILARHNAITSAVGSEKAGTEFIFSLPFYRPEDRALTLRELDAEIEKVKSEIELLDKGLAIQQKGTLERPGLDEVYKLVAGTAGDLLNELWAIKPFIQQMVKDADGENSSIEGLKRIDRSCHYCVLLLKNLLGLEVEEEKGVLQAVDINAVVRDTVMLLENKILPGIDVNWELDEAMPVTQGDELQLQQVVMNLVRNALDAMPERGTLTLRSEVLNGHVLVQVADTGCGIPAENLDRIFDLYFTTKREGYGIGLQIVQSVVEEHGGEVTVESQVNKGTTFTVRLPVASVSQPSRQRERMQRDADSGARADVTDSSDTLGLPLILIVEDDSYWLEDLERGLQSHHYGIHKTRKVGEALELVQKNKYALILLDWYMPDPGGPAGMLEAVQKTETEVPIIVLSAHGDTEQRSRALKLGARDFIDKPQKTKQWDALKRKVSDAVSSKPTDMDKPT